MASANVDLVRSIFAAWERGEFGVSGWADPAVEFARADGPAPGSWKGSADISSAMREVLSAWSGFSVEADEYREPDNEHVLVFVRITGRGKRSGLEGRQLGARAAMLFRLRHRKVTRIVTYYDRERALADLGIAPELG